VLFGALLAMDLTQRAPKRWISVIKGAGTLCILLTFVVYHFVLRSQFFSMGIETRMTLSNLLVHYITPLMVFADYLIFDAKGRYRWADPFWWVLIPVFYAVYTFIYIGLGGTYRLDVLVKTDFPYFFFDYVTFGVGRVVAMLSAIVAAYIAVSYAVVGLDRLWASSKSGRGAKT
jgi:hypothetical protein